MATSIFSRLMSIIIPHHENDFHLFNQLADCSVKASKELTMMAAVNDPTQFDAHFAEIRNIESEADSYTQAILLSLHKTFITPFDRREIRELAMVLGNLLGGWRVVRSMRMGITNVRKTGGFCAQTSSSIALFLATLFGISVSTTHTITGAIVGVGLSRRVSAVRWGLVSRIL